MNCRGVFHHAPLKTCRVCGMDSGVRKVKEGHEEQFFIVCEVCGYMTRPHKNQSAATKEWNGSRGD